MPAGAGRAGGSPGRPLARRVLLHPSLASLLPRLAGREEGGTENPFARKEQLLSQLAHTHPPGCEQRTGREDTGLLPQRQQEMLS